MTLSPKQQLVYKEFYKKGVFTLDEVKTFLKNYRTAVYTVKGLLDSKYAKKVKQSLYYIVPFELAPDVHNNFSPDKLLIGANFTKDCFLSHHSALEIHGATDKTMNHVHITSKFRVPGLKHKKVNYNVIVSQNYFGFTDIEYNNNLVKVSDRERTILDCLRNINYTPGFDELKQAIPKLKPIDFEKCFSYLKKIGESSLIARTGYTLELLQSEVDTPQWFINKLKKNLSNRTYYLDASKKGNSKHYKEWRLMVPV